MQDGQRFGSHTVLEPRIQPRERLVHQQHRRARRQRPRQRDALLLAAGQHVGIGLCIAVEADTGQRDHRFAPAFDARQGGEAEADVLDDRQMRKQSEILEYEADRALLRRHVDRRARNLAVVEEDAARGLGFDAGGDPQSVVLPDPDGQGTGPRPARRSARRRAASADRVRIHAGYPRRPAGRRTTRRPSPFADFDFNTLLLSANAPAPSRALCGQRTYPVNIVRGRWPGLLLFDARRQKAEFLEIDVGQRILVIGKQVGLSRRLGHREIARHARRQKAGALQFVNAGQIADFLEAEMIENCSVEP